MVFEVSRSCVLFVVFHRADGTVVLGSGAEDVTDIDIEEEEEEEEEAEVFVDAEEDCTLDPEDFIRSSSDLCCRQKVRRCAGLGLCQIGNGLPCPGMSSLLVTLMHCVPVA